MVRSGDFQGAVERGPAPPSKALGVGPSPVSDRPLVMHRRFSRRFRASAGAGGNRTGRAWVLTRPPAGGPAGPAGATEGGRAFVRFRSASARSFCATCLRKRVTATGDHGISSRPWSALPVDQGKSRAFNRPTAPGRWPAVPPDSMRHTLFRLAPGGRHRRGSRRLHAAAGRGVVPNPLPSRRG